MATTGHRKKTGTCPPVPQQDLPGAIGRVVLFVHLVLSPLVFSIDTLEAFEYSKVTLLLLAAIVLGVLGLTARLGKLLQAPAGERSLATLGRRLKRLAQRCRGGPAAPLAPVLGGEGNPPHRDTNLQTALQGLWREPVALGLLLFVASAVASTVTSISPRTSLRGAHESYAGLRTVLAYAVLFFATRGCCRTAADGRRLLAAPVIGAAVASVYAVLQVGRLDVMRWEHAPKIGAYLRPFATMGHPNFLAAFLVMTFPLTACLAFRAARERRRWCSTALLLVGALSCLAVALSVSRGAWLAFGGMLAVLAAGAWRLIHVPSPLVPSRARAMRWPAAMACILALVGLALILVGAASPRTRGLLVTMAERARRLTASSSRLYIWRAGLNLFHHDPLFGCGLDTFSLAFARERTLAYWYTEWNATPARAHNEAIHILATQGLFGGVAALMMTAGLVVAAFRAWRRVPRDVKPLVVAAAAGLLGFVLQDLFSFTVAGCGTLFVTLAAVLSRLANPPGEPESVRPADGLRWWAGSVFGAGSLAALVLVYNVATGLSTGGRGVLLGCLAVLLTLFLVSLVVLRVEWGVVAGADTPARGVEKPDERPRALAARIVQLGVWAGAAALLATQVVQPWRANLACRTGDRLLEGNPAGALDSYGRAVALDPGQELYWTRLGNAAQLLASRGPSPAERRRLLLVARQAMERARDLVPVNSYQHDNLGQLLRLLAAEGLASPGQVFDEFDTALALDRNNVYFYEDACEAARALGDTARARRYCDRGLERCFFFAPLGAQQGYLALMDKQYDRAVSLLRATMQGQWLGDEEGRVRATCALSATLLQLRCFDEALHWAQRVVRKAPERPAPRLLAATALEMLGRKDEAIAEYRTVLACCPTEERARAALERLKQETK